MRCPQIHPPPHDHYHAHHPSPIPALSRSNISNAMHHSSYLMLTKSLKPAPFHHHFTFHAWPSPSHTHLYISLSTPRHAPLLVFLKPVTNLKRKQTQRIFGDAQLLHHFLVFLLYKQIQNHNCTTNITAHVF